MKGIYNYYYDCGMVGELDGIFVADSKEVEAVIGKEVHFGEVLGKHSDVSGTIEVDEITLMTDDQDFIKQFEKIMGSGTISGINPLDYMED